MYDWRDFAAAAGLWAATLLTSLPVQAADEVVKRPVLIGLDAAFSLAHSTSAPSLSRGAETAIHEINAAGGVLGGRALELVTRDNHAMPARGIHNFQELASIPDLVAVIGGRFSPVVMAQAKLAEQHQTLLLAAWSAANPITAPIDGRPPRYVFRLSLRDGLAMPVMLQHAVDRGYERVGLMLLTTAWGRSNEAAALSHVGTAGAPALVHSNWIHWRQEDYVLPYAEHLAAGAQAIVVVGNDDEVARLVEVAASRPAGERLPIISHWGVTGGDFLGQLSSVDVLDKVDLSVVQTFSFYTARPEKVAQVLRTTERLFGIERIDGIEAPVGFAHAYDLVHLLARAIELAGTTERSAVRDALERVRDYDGLVRHFQQPFTPQNHDALQRSDVFMARYRSDGAIMPIDKMPSKP